MVGSGKRWTWEICTIHFLGKDFWQGGRDQCRQIKLMCRIHVTLHVSAEFQLSKANLLINFHGNLKSCLLRAFKKKGRNVIYFVGGGLIIKIQTRILFVIFTRKDDKSSGKKAACRLALSCCV